jgi:hypothetical protein
MKVRNNFESWLQEATLKNNPAIPGESGEIGKMYLQGVEDKAREKLRDLSRRLGADIPQFMGLVNQAKRLQDPHKEALEKLAQEVILDFYGSILEETILDIKFTQEGEIPNMMSDVPAEAPEMPALKQLEDQGVINKIQKRKIANNITQGEAKNAKKALNSEISTEGIISIMGEQNGRRYIEILNKITDIADFFDWSIPMEVQKDMWERDKSGFSGSVKVSWENEDDDEDEEQKDALDILKDLEENPDFDPEKLEDLFDDGKTKITARGADYAMLLHETIKGIYELIAAASIPKDEETAEVVIMNTDTLADEIEDLRYGPYIAQDLRDFINTFPEVDRIENLREFVFGHILDENNLSDEDFLKLMNDILLGIPVLLDPNANIQPEFADQIKAAASRAKMQMSRIIKEISQMVGDYERSVAGLETGETPGRAPGGIADAGSSKKEIMDQIDAALDRGDYAEAKRLSDILNQL